MRHDLARQAILVIRAAGEFGGAIALTAAAAGARKRAFSSINGETLRADGHRVAAR